MNSLPDSQRILDALRFYRGSPDGYYDIDVVVPILEWILEGGTPDFCPNCHIPLPKLRTRDQTDANP